MSISTARISVIVNHLKPNINSNEPQNKGDVAVRCRAKMEEIKPANKIIRQTLQIKPEERNEALENARRKIIKMPDENDSECVLSEFYSLFLAIQALYLCEYLGVSSLFSPDFNGE